MFEGPQNAQSLEHLALLSMTLQESLLQSVSPRPGEPEVIHVGAAWPPGWDATFRLLTRGGFLVTAAIEKDNLVGIELASWRGEICRLHNPWNKPVQVSERSEDNRPLAVQELPGGVLVFETKPGHSYQIIPAEEDPPSPRRVSPLPTVEPADYSVTLPNGAIVKGMLGLRHS